jgi:hypothetical protein
MGRVDRIGIDAVRIHELISHLLVEVNAKFSCPGIKVDVGSHFGL